MDLWDLGEEIASDALVGSGPQETIPWKISQRFNYGAGPCSNFSKTPICRQRATPQKLHPDSGMLGSHCKWWHFYIHLQGNTPTVFQLESRLQNSMLDFMRLSKGSCWPKITELLSPW